MAGLSTDAKATTAFKKLIGLANSATNIPYYSESIPSQISISSAEIIGEEINSNPSAATNIQFVDADLAEIPSANGYSYRMVFPTGTTLNGVDVSGDPIADHTVLVPEKLNKSGFIQPDDTGGYAYDLYNDDSRVSPLDSRLWVVDPIACIVTSEEPLNLGSTGHVYVYVYTGEMLDDVILSTSEGTTDNTGTTSNTFTLDSDADNHVVLTNNTTPANTAELQLWDAESNNLADLLVGNINGVDIQNLESTVTNLTTDDIDEGTTNLYYTDERVQDIMSTSLIGGDGVTVSYDDGTGQITIDAEFSEFSTDNVVEGSTNLFFTDERARNAIATQDLYIRNDGDTATGDYNFNAGLFVIDESANTLNSDGSLYISGDITTPSTVTCGELIETSTRVAKKNINPMNNEMVDRLMMLKPVNFKWKANDKDSFGFIAEEVESIFPELVRYDDNGKMLGMNYSKLVSVLVQNVQTLNRSNEVLRNKLSELEAKVG